MIDESGGGGWVKGEEERSEVGCDGEKEREERVAEGRDGRFYAWEGAPTPIDILMEPEVGRKLRVVVVVDSDLDLRHQDATYQSRAEASRSYHSRGERESRLPANSLLKQLSIVHILRLSMRTDRSYCP